MLILILIPVEELYFDLFSSIRGSEVMKWIADIGVVLMHSS